MQSTRKKLFCTSCGSALIVRKPDRGRCTHNQCKLYEIDRPLSSFSDIRPEIKKVKKEVETTEPLRLKLPRLLMDKKRAQIIDVEEMKPKAIPETASDGQRPLAIDIAIAAAFSLAVFFGMREIRDGIRRNECYQSIDIKEKQLPQISEGCHR